LKFAGVCAGRAASIKEVWTALARFHPRKIYGLLMKTAADALQKLVRDPRYAGARIGALAVLS